MKISLKFEAGLMKIYRVSGSGIDENHQISWSGIDEVKVSRY